MFPFDGRTGQEAEVIHDRVTLKILPAVTILFVGLCSWVADVTWKWVTYSSVNSQLRWLAIF